MKELNKLECTIRELFDSYFHYRMHSACGVFESIKRTVIFQIYGREKWVKYPNDTELD